MASGDPGERRVRKPSKTRTFQAGHVDPVIGMKRPLLTWGNAVLVAIMLAFGLYATGNLPQVDQFFNYLDVSVRSHNNGVVSAIVTYLPYLFGAFVFIVFSWFIFLFINGRRRRASDPKGWHRVTQDVPNRVRRERRVDEPSMFMPLGKERRTADGTLIPTTGDRRGAPDRRTADARVNPDPRNHSGTPEPIAINAAAAATPSPVAFEVAPGFAAAVKPVPILSAREQALLAAQRAEAAADAAPTDLPSFVVPLGKQKKTGGGTVMADPNAAPAIPVTQIPTPPTAPLTPVVTPELIAAAPEPPPPPPEPIAAAPAPPPPPPVLAPEPTTADLEAQTAALMAAAAMAAAKAEVAKAELAMITARAEAAKAELALLTARAEAAKSAI